MSWRDLNLENCDRLVAAAIGEPGQRVFHLQAVAGPEVVTLVVEKVQLQALATRIEEVLEAVSDQAMEGGAWSLQEPFVPAFRVGQLGLAFDSHRKLVLIIAEELVGEDEDLEQAATARLWSTPAVARKFAAQAMTVAAAGRTACPLCGFPMDARGHVCPKANGSRPVM